MHAHRHRLRQALGLPLLLAGAIAAKAAASDALLLPSATLAETRRVEVTLPASYDWATERRYPVLYLLDGQTHAEHAIASSRFLADQGELPELIVVSVRSTVRIRDFTQTDWPQRWIGGGGAANFMRFLASELIPRIEHDYRTAPYRILVGHSASGQYALHQLATQPETFHAYVVLAPSLDWDDGLPIRELEAAVARADRPYRFVYFAYGDDREAALAADLQLARAFAAAKPGTLRSEVRAFPEERHSALPLLGLIDGLRTLYAGYALPEELTTKGLSAVEAHFAALAQRLGTPLAIPEMALNELGYELLGEGHTAEAIAVFERAARENPGSANSWDSLADALDEGGKSAEALRASKHAVELATRYDLPNRADFEHALAKRQKKAASRTDTGTGAVH